MTQGEKVGHKGLSLEIQNCLFLSWLRGKGEGWGVRGYQEVRGEGGRGYNG